MFSGGGGSQSFGAPTTEGPSDGATSGQVRSILEGLSNAADNVSGVVNAFRGGVNDQGRATQAVVTQPAPAQPGNKLLIWLGLAAAAVAVWFFVIRKR